MSASDLRQSIHLIGSTMTGTTNPVMSVGRHPTSSEETSGESTSLLCSAPSPICTRGRTSRRPLRAFVGHALRRDDAALCANVSAASASRARLAGELADYVRGLGMGQHKNEDRREIEAPIPAARPAGT